MFSLTSNVAFSTFDKKTDADIIVMKGKGKSKHSFGSRYRRFAYSPTVIKDGIVCPGSYDVKDNYDSTKNRKARYSIGTSRDQMQTLFVDDVATKGKKHTNCPGPFSYDKPKPFGTIGIFSAFRPKLYKSGMRVDKYDSSYFD